MMRGPNFEGPFIQVDRMADGVITFLDMDQAERFRALVEAEDESQFEIHRMRSDSLFRGTMDAKAVVILVHSSVTFPSVQELSTSLKSQSPFEGDN